MIVNLVTAESLCAFHQATRDFSMQRALSILDGLRDEPLRRAS